MCTKTSLAIFAAVLLQFALFDLLNHAARAEDDDVAEDTDDDKSPEDDPNDPRDEPVVKDEDDGELVPEGECPRPFFREYCSEDKPCCLYNKESYTCQAAKQEGEECSQNAFGYNTRNCYCKQGLFCIDGKCTSKVPLKQEEAF